MKTISIRELHQATGRYVREARQYPLVVTDRGREVAILKRFSAHDLPGTPFPARDPRDLPAIAVDSTTLISADREGR